MELINDLNDNLMTYIARNRFPEDAGRAGLERVKRISQSGPYTASEAIKAGLLNGVAYRQDVIDSVADDEAGGDSKRKLMGMYHYSKVMEKAVEKHVKDAIEVGVVYLLGTIGDAGE